MTAILDRLFGLDRLSLASKDVDIHFVHEFPLWAWTLGVLALFAVAGWSYRRLEGRLWARATLGVIRGVLLVVVAVLLAGPELIRQNERTESDWVVVMADRSASMTLGDVETGDARTTRDAQAAEALRAASPAFRALEEKRRVLYLGFDSGVFDLPVADGVPTLSEPAGRRTAIGQSLDQALRRVAGRPVAGIVLLSDGRSSDTVGRPVLHQLETRQIPVFGVPLGSADPPADYAVARVEAPTSAFVGDHVPVTVQIVRQGSHADAPVKVRLVDQSTGEVLDERVLPPDREGVTLQTRPASPGEAGWRVEVVPDRRDLTEENNTASLRVELVDRPIRVVYFDGYPRWENRYLRWLLTREPSIRSSSLLLAADRRYLQEGTEVLATVPRTQEEWNAIDVVILGDVRPGLFSEEQLTQLRALVAERGGGLLWIGGEGYTPGAWRATPLADLLPFSPGVDPGSVGSGGPRAWLVPVLMKPGPAAERFGVLQLSESPDDPWPAELGDASQGWPLLRWAQRIDAGALKPTAEVVATATPADPATPGSSALITTMRYGAGRVVYVATDETWRYRYGRGDQLSERLWLPLVRLLARESLGRTGKPATLSVNPDRAQVGQQVQVSVRLVDQALIDARPRSIVVRVRRDGAAGDGVALTLRPIGDDDSAAAPTFVAPWVSGDPGTFTVTSDDPLLAGLDLSASVRYSLPDDELRTPLTDHALLADLADRTGGRVLKPDELAGIADLLPNREVRLLGTPDVETLWDKPVVWVLLMVLLAAEWAGRRLVKLA